MDRAKQDARAKEFLDDVAATLTARAATYPAYSVEASNVAQVWNTLNTARPLAPQDIAKLMMIVKLVRHSAGNSPDSLVDLVGYAARLEGMEGTDED